MTLEHSQRWMMKTDETDGLNQIVNFFFHPETKTKTSAILFYNC